MLCRASAQQDCMPSFDEQAIHFSHVLSRDIAQYKRTSYIFYTTSNSLDQIFMVHISPRTCFRGLAHSTPTIRSFDSPKDDLRDPWHHHALVLSLPCSSKSNKARLPAPHKLRLDSAAVQYTHVIPRFSLLPNTRADSSNRLCCVFVQLQHDTLVSFIYDHLSLRIQAPKKSRNLNSECTKVASEDRCKDQTRLHATPMPVVGLRKQKVLVDL